MNRPFPRLLLKIERGSLSHRETTWLHFNTSIDMSKTARYLVRTVPDIVRITSISVGHNRKAEKLTIYTPHEAPWQFTRHFLSSRSQRVSATAILPKEVLKEVFDEATC